MKQCPKCNRTYADDTLRFCLEDGTSLSRVSGAPDSYETLPTRDANPPPTERFSYDRSAPTLKVSGPTRPSFTPSNELSTPRETARSNTLLTAGVISIAVLLLALVGIVAYFVLAQPGKGGTQINSTAAPTKQSASPIQSVVTASPSPGNSEIITNAGLKITASASSIRYAVQNNTYYAANAIDGKRSTAWIEGADGSGIGEWIRFDFDREITLHKILIQPGYFKSPEIWAENGRIAALTASFSDGSSRVLNFPDVMQSQKVDIGSIRTRWVKLTIKDVYPGKDPDTAISEVAFEWEL
jgi:F5/8 type C domain